MAVRACWESHFEILLEQFNEQYDIHEILLKFSRYIRILHLQQSDVPSNKLTNWLCKQLGIDINQL